MKKIFLIILMLFLLNFKAEAKEVYYSEYNDFSDYSLDLIESSELINVEQERRFRFYEELKVGEYRRLFDDNSKFAYFDLKDKKNSDFSEWSEFRSENLEGRIIETKKFYKIKEPKAISHISFFNTLDTIITLKDVEIYYLDKKLDYEIILDLADSDFNIYPWGTITYDLKGYYDLQKITIKVKNIEFNGSSEILVLARVLSDYNDYYINYFSYNLMNFNDTNILIDSTNWIRGDAEYGEEVISESKPSGSSLLLISEITMHRYQDALFYFYNIEKKYIDGYFVDYPSLIKDEDNYEDYYRYQTRDKLEIEDEILIQNHEQKLSDFIKSSVQYEIITNLDMNKNGIYEVEIKTPFISVKKDVVVNINENNNIPITDNNDLNKIIEENSQLKLEINTLLDKNNNLKQELDNLFSDYSDLLNKNNTLEQEFNGLISDYSNLSDKYNNIYKKTENKCEIESNEEKKDHLLNEINNQLSSNILSINRNEEFIMKKSDYLWFSAILLLLLVLLLLILKKMSNKNNF